LILRRTSILLFLIPIAVAAQEPPPRTRLDDLVAAALKNNPEILAAQKKYEASRQRPTQESTLPDPMIAAGWNASGNPLPGAGLGKEPVANIGVMVSQPVPFPGKLKLRGDMASAEARAQYQEYQNAELNVISRLKQAWYQLYYTYAARDVLARSRELLTQLLNVSQAQYTVGKAAQQDVLKAQTQLTILETRLVKLEQERRSREAEINSLLARGPMTPVGRPEDVTPKPLTAAVEDLFAAAEKNSPMLRRDRSMLQRAELAQNLARKEYYPDFTLNAGYYSMGSMPPMYMFRADVTLPLYSWRKQRAGVAEQAANAAAARRTLESTDQALHYQIRNDYEAAQASSKLMGLYQKTVVPQSSLTLESSLATYQSGTTDFLSVLSNFGMVLDYQMNYYDELLNYMMALSRLEQMTGERLTD
jgi:outer membrane protein TolC